LQTELQATHTIPHYLQQQQLECCTQLTRFHTICSSTNTLSAATLLAHHLQQHKSHTMCCNTVTLHVQHHCHTICNTVTQLANTLFAVTLSAATRVSYYLQQHRHTKCAVSLSHCFVASLSAATRVSNYLLQRSLMSRSLQQHESHNMCSNTVTLHVQQHCHMISCHALCNNTSLT